MIGGSSRPHECGARPSRRAPDRAREDIHLRVLARRLQQRREPAVERADVVVDEHHQLARRARARRCCARRSGRAAACAARSARRDAPPVRAPPVRLRRRRRPAPPRLPPPPVARSRRAPPRGRAGAPRVGITIEAGGASGLIGSDSLGLQRFRQLRPARGWAPALGSRASGSLPAQPLPHDRRRGARSRRPAVARARAPRRARRAARARLRRELGRGRAALGLLRGGLDPDEVQRAVRAHGARVVHAHNLQPAFGWRALAAARAAGREGRAAPAPVPARVRHRRVLHATARSAPAATEATRCPACA